MMTPAVEVLILDEFLFVCLTFLSPLLQIVLGAEGTSLEFRHIVSYLLWYCSHWPNEVLLHELILSVDYFVVLNSDNQVLLKRWCRCRMLMEFFVFVVYFFVTILSLFFF